MEILPTHSCFDDALDYIEMLIRAGGEQTFVWMQDNIRLVHAICLAPGGPHKDTPFAHAWVEQSEQKVIQAGIIQGEKVYFECLKAEYYEKMRVQKAERYTLKQVWEHNLRTNHYGPWESDIRALCGGRAVFKES